VIVQETEEDREDQSQGEIKIEEDEYDSVVLISAAGDEEMNSITKSIHEAIIFEVDEE
jgi:hypothetical protein